MNKKKRKQKRHRDRFPWTPKDEYYFHISITGDEIITDAGHENVSFEDACKFFSPSEIKEWYESEWEGADLEDLFAELEIDIDLDDEDAVDKFFETYDWTPKTLEIIVAKAVYENHAWVRVLTFVEPWNQDNCFDDYEEQAILLGIHMRKKLGLDVAVINDNKNAVRNCQAFNKIGWEPRKNVKAAHKLTIAQSTKQYDEFLWDEEWEEDDWDNSLFSPDE